jgi:hypothetical protein
MDFPQKQFITTKDARKLSGYTSDYLARLARSGEVVGEKIGHSWCIDQASLESFLEKQKNHNINRAEELMHLRSKEYREHNEKIQQLQGLPVESSKVNSIEQFVPGLGLGHVSFRSQTFALSVAFFVVASGVAFSHIGESSQFTNQTASIVQEFSSGFNEMFGDVPSQIVSSISAMNTGMTMYSLHIAEHNLLHVATINVVLASPALAVPSLPTGNLEEISTARLHEDNSTVPTVVEFSRASLASAAITFGNTIIEVSHAAIRADVAVAYAPAIFAPQSARSVITFLGTTGAVLASATSQIPDFATILYLRTTSSPVYLAPALAQAVFGTEYSIVNPFVAFSNTVSERYLALIDDAGRFLYGGAKNTLALSSAFRGVLVGIEDAYMGSIDRTALAINDTATVFSSASALTSLTAPIKNSSGLFESVSVTGLASVLLAFSAGEKAVMNAYETICAFFDVQTKEQIDASSRNGSLITPAA